MKHFRLSIALRSLACAFGVLALLLAFGCAEKTPKRALLLTDSSTVGRVETNSYITPTGQLLAPAGQQVELPGMRPQALAFSPDGKVIVTAGKTKSLVVNDAVTGLILQRA